MFLWQAVSDYMTKPADIELGELEKNKKLLDLIKAGDKEAIAQLNMKLVDQYLDDFELFKKNFAFLKRADVNLLSILRDGFLKEVMRVSPPGATRINPFIKDIILSFAAENKVQLNWVKTAIAYNNYDLAIWLLATINVNAAPAFSILEDVLNKDTPDSELPKLLPVAKLLKDHGAGFGHLSDEKREKFLEWEEKQPKRVKPVQTVRSPVVESKVQVPQDASKILGQGPSKIEKFSM